MRMWHLCTYHWIWHRVFWDENLAIGPDVQCRLTGREAVPVPSRKPCQYPQGRLGRKIKTQTGLTSLVKFQNQWCVGLEWFSRSVEKVWKDAFYKLSAGHESKWKSLKLVEILSLPGSGHCWCSNHSPKRWIPSTLNILLYGCQFDFLPSLCTKIEREINSNCLNWRRATATLLPPLLPPRNAVWCSCKHEMSQSETILA